MSREGADVRLARLLAIVPWVAAHDGPQVEEVCRRFGVAEKELLQDLNLLFMCGLYPFTPDMLIEVTVTDGRVWITMADYFRRPLRLNAQEGLALVAAATAFLELSGSGPATPLATALDKLQTVLGLGPEDAVQVELGPASQGVLDVVRDAVARRLKVDIEYYSFGRDRSARRTVRPWQVFNTGGQWYLSAWCEQAGAERLFRVDRISDAVVLQETFAVPDDAAGRTLAVFNPGPQDPVLVLDLAPDAHWIAEQYPNEGVDSRPGGVLRVRLRAAGQAWTERLLLRAGSAATVVEGDAALGPAAAQRVLTRYRATGPLG